MSKKQSIVQKNNRRVRRKKKRITPEQNLNSAQQLKAPNYICVTSSY